MNLRVLTIFCILCCCCACTKSKSELTIPEEKLIGILADAHIIESTLQTNYAHLKDSISNVYYQQLFEMHSITEVEFLNNLKILEANAKLMADIYSKVMDELSKKEADHNTSHN